MNIVRTASIAAAAALIVGCATVQPIGPVQQPTTPSIPMPIPQGSGQQGQQSSQQGQQAGQPGQQGQSQASGGQPSSQSGQQSGQTGSQQGQQSGQGGQQSASTGGLPSGGGGGGTSRNSTVPLGIPGGGGQGQQAEIGSEPGGQGAGDASEDGQSGDGTENGQVAGTEGVFGSSETFGRAGSGADEAFGESLEEFDEQMSSEQEAIGQAGGGSAADEALQEAGGQIEGPAGGGGPGNQTSGGPLAEVDDPRLDPARNGPPVEGCVDEDPNARMLCEYATREPDPFVKANLWDEYNEYVRVVRNQ